MPIHLMLTSYANLCQQSAAQRLVLALLAEKQWILNSWDFTTAFLQGKSLTRDVFDVPPIDFVGSYVVWRLNKLIYGIVSAPKS
jgi:Reverse transcriptase (RNA-dependent DNA polymerase)